MKKISLFIICLIYLHNIQAQEDCGSVLNLAQLQQADPVSYQRFINLETHTQNYIAQQNNANARLINANGEIIIPVVVHIVHRGESIGVGTNISDAQINSQIDVLNEDFNYLNTDRFNIPTAFQSLAGSANISFRLACLDPNSNPTTGITRTQTTVSEFSSNNDVKTTATGGINPWITEKYLNIWVCDLNGSLLGYSQFPFNFAGKPNTDGIVVDYKAFGRVGNLFSNYNLGRTASHEIGHWLNLLHLDGDTRCGVDFVDDTPEEYIHNFSPCPSFPHNTVCNNTTNGEMFMNTMNSIPHACRLLFTKGQVLRMRAIFAVGGPRETFINNYFSLNANTVNTQCGKTITAINPMCLPITWSVTGGATLIQSGNTCTVTPLAFGSYTITATTGNYTDSKTILFNPSDFGLNLTSTNIVCNTPVTYTLANLASGSTLNWSISPISGIVSSTISGNNITLTRQTDGDIILTATVNSLCNLPPFSISNSIRVGIPSTPTLLGQPASQPNQPTKWSFAAPSFSGASYHWYTGNCANTVFPYNCTPSITTRYADGDVNTLSVFMPCKNQFAIGCKISNACGTSQLSNFVAIPTGYCPPKITKFDPAISILQHDLLKVNIASNTNNWLSNLFMEDAALADEMIQKINIYNKSGELMIESDDLHTQNATVDIAQLPQGSYIVEVVGLNEYKELHTIHRSLLNQEHYLIEDIATGNIPMNVNDAEKRLYVLQQKLFSELQSEPQMVQESGILQEFTLNNAGRSFGTIYQIDAAIGTNNLGEAQAYVNNWDATNEIDENFKNYYNIYLKILDGNTINVEEQNTLQSIAQGCPLVDGEIVYAARSLYNSVVSASEDFSTACAAYGAKYTTKPTKLNEYLNAETSISPNPTKGIITIKLPAKDTGFKTIKITDAYGKIIAERKTFDRVIMMDVKAPIGMYFVNITNIITGKTETQKIIINN